GTNRVERETRPRPVAATAELAELAKDAGFVLIFPLPNAFDQLLAAKVVAGLAFFLTDSAFDHRLRGDAGVVGAGHPEGVVSLHSAPANEHVLGGVIGRVPHGPGAGGMPARGGAGVR